MKTNVINELYAFPGTKQLVSFFEGTGHEIRFVGGCVRNALLGEKFSDIDFAVTSPPETTIEILKHHKINVIPTGLDHGTVTAIVEGNQFEITTTRSDISTDGRHAKVEYSSSFEDDAKRRDFTINAMSVSVHGELFDYFHGREDLQDGKIRFVGDAEQRVQEDYLRIFRLYRFYSYYGKTIDEKSKFACNKYAHNIVKLSGERIRSEFGKILTSPKVLLTIQMMYDDTVLQKFLPIEELKLEWLANLIKICKENKLPQDVLRNLITIIYGQDPDLKFWVKSKKEQEYLAILCNLDLKDSFSCDRLVGELYKLGEHIFLEKYLLSLTLANANDFKSKYKQVINCKMPVFPVRGRDFIELGIPPGKDLGKYLQIAEEAWIKSDFSLSKEAIIDKIRSQK